MSATINKLDRTPFEPCKPSIARNARSLPICLRGCTTVRLLHWRETVRSWHLSFLPIRQGRRVLLVCAAETSRFRTISMIRLPSWKRFSTDPTSTVKWVRLSRRGLAPLERSKAVAACWLAPLLNCFNPRPNAGATLKTTHMGLTCNSNSVS